MKASTLISAVLLTAISTCSQAGLVNDVPSCYQAMKLTITPPAPTKLVYVLVDQTTALDTHLQASVEQNLARLLVPGSKFVVAEFSAFSQGRYLQVLYTGIIEAPLSEEQKGNVPMRLLPRLAKCFEQQQGFAKAMAIKALKGAMSNADNALDQSDILAALQQVAKAIKDDQATQKVLLLASDTLENSAALTFYHRHTVARINPQTALAKAKQAGLISDFGGAKVYVIGAASLPAAKKGNRAEVDGYRDPITLGRLKQFWRDYITTSKGQLAGFGEPALLQPVEY